MERDREIEGRFNSDSENGQLSSVPGPHAQPRTGEEESDSEFSSDESDVDINVKNMSNLESPAHLLQAGRVIVPHFSPNRTSGHTVARLGHSQGSVGIQVRPDLMHNELLWIASSQNTMHMVNQVPVNFHHMVKSGSRMNPLDMKRTPSNLSRQVSNCNYSSLTMSDTGTDMCSICRICQMPETNKDPLIAPCRCAGSMRFVHTSCLKVCLLVFSLNNLIYCITIIIF